MNTPTPAQALGEVMSIYDFALSTERYETYRTFETAAGELLRQHGQHFAGLEKEAAELRAWKAEEVAFLLKAAAMFGGTGYKGEGILGGIEHLKSELAMEQRHYAQAREDYAALSAEFRRQIKEAEARVREAEGLLRGIIPYLPPRHLAQQTRERIAAFIAANGETK